MQNGISHNSRSCNGDGRDSNETIPKADDNDNDNRRQGRTMTADDNHDEDGDGRR